MEKTPNLRVMLVDTTVPRSTKELVAGVGMRLKEVLFPGGNDVNAKTDAIGYDCTAGLNGGCDSGE